MKKEYSYMSLLVLFMLVMHVIRIVLTALRSFVLARLELAISVRSSSELLRKLLSGLLTPWSGSIEYDGKQIGCIDEQWLCQSLSVVTQNPEIFAGTIRENVTMWKADYPDSMLFRALEESEAHTFVESFRDGAEHRLYEGGSNLSGGQKQLLQIARALFTEPSILVMDEATSALDVVTERNVMRNIKARGCTCIIIAHRLSTIRDCDLILVLDKGSVVESGTHEQLMKNNGLYAKLVSG